MVLATGAPLLFSKWISNCTKEICDREGKMTGAQPKTKGKFEYAPPPVDGDFYSISSVLDAKERVIVKRVRDFMESEVAPIIEDYWARDKFPFEIVPKIAKLDIGGVGYRGYGAAGGSWLLNGF